MSFEIPRLYNWARQVAYNALQIPRPTQRSDCYILDVPSDVLLVISSRLSLWDRSRLSQVSLSLRTTIRTAIEEGTLVSSAEDRVDYLIRRAHNLPDHWVCEKCIALHRVDDIDCPTSPRGCPVEAGAGFKPTFYRLALYQLEHRHVQLAIKYARMGGYQGRYRKRLERLLTTSRCDVSGPWEPHPIWGTNRFPGKGYWRASPMITQGRFLLTSGVVFHPHEQGQLGRDHTSAIKLCSHQCWVPGVMRKLEKLRELGTAISFSEAMFLQQVKWMEENDLSKAVAELLKNRGSETTVHCPYCPSEATVTISRDADGRNRIEGKFWHDFGPEGSPLDPQWRSKQFPERHVAGCTYPISPHYPVARGSVRAFWKKGPENE